MIYLRNLNLLLFINICLVFHVLTASIESKIRTRRNYDANAYSGTSLPNSCATGHMLAIWEGETITETYCRCADGSYGFTCSENFANPCLSGNQQYHAADARLPRNYFVECESKVPFLMKCAKGTVWIQELLTCSWPNRLASSYYSAPTSSSSSSYANQYSPSYVQTQPQNQYSAPAVSNNQAIQTPVQSQYFSGPVQTQNSYTAAPQQQPQYQTYNQYETSKPLSLKGLNAIKKLSRGFTNVPPRLPVPLLSADQLINTCRNGYAVPIWEVDQITEMFCRCPDGTYGFTCTEGFANLCYTGQQYFPADPSIPSNYFIECKWKIPYLMKCAKGTYWNQAILTCDRAYVDNYAGGVSYGSSSYESGPSGQYDQQYGQTSNSYGQSVVVKPVETVTSSYAYQAPYQVQQATYQQPIYHVPETTTAPALYSSQMNYEQSNGYTAQQEQQVVQPSYSNPQQPAYQQPQYANTQPSTASTYEQQSTQSAYQQPSASSSQVNAYQQQEQYGSNLQENAQQATYQTNNQNVYQQSQFESNGLQGSIGQTSLNQGFQADLSTQAQMGLNQGIQSGFTSQSQTGFNTQGQSGFNGQTQTGFGQGFQSGLNSQAQMGLNQGLQSGFTSQTGFNSPAAGLNSLAQTGLSQGFQSGLNSQPQMGINQGIQSGLNSQGFQAGLNGQAQMGLTQASQQPIFTHREQIPGFNTLTQQGLNGPSTIISHGQALLQQSNQQQATSNHVGVNHLEKREDQAGQVEQSQAFTGLNQATYEQSNQNSYQQPQYQHYLPTDVSQSYNVQTQQPTVTQTQINAEQGYQPQSYNTLPAQVQQSSYSNQQQQQQTTTETQANQYAVQPAHQSTYEQQSAYQQPQYVNSQPATYEQQTTQSVYQQPADASSQTNAYQQLSSSLQKGLQSEQSQSKDQINAILNIIKNGFNKQTLNQPGQVLGSSLTGQGVGLQSSMNQGSLGQGDVQTGAGFGSLQSSISGAALGQSGFASQNSLQTFSQVPTTTLQQSSSLLRLLQPFISSSVATGDQALLRFRLPFANTQTATGREPCPTPNGIEIGMTFSFF